MDNINNEKNKEKIFLIKSFDKNILLITKNQKEFDWR